MEEIYAEDVEILDYILKRCVENNGIADKTNLRPLGNKKLGNLPVVLMEEYRRYFKIIQSYKVANYYSERGSAQNNRIEAIEYKTEYFLRDGGFE